MTIKNTPKKDIVIYKKTPFYKGQAVLINLPGAWLGRRGIIDCNQSLSYFFKKTGKIPVSDIKGVGSYSFSPEYLEPVKKIKIKKGGVKSMPRIFKWAFMFVVFLMFLKFSYPFVDLILQFLQGMIKK